jgi:hypothetical protein
VSRRISSFRAFLLLALAGCATPRPPELPHAIDSAWGTVHSARRDDAIRISAVVDRVAPRIAASLPARATTPLDIRLVPRMSRPHWGGATFTTAAGRWIEVPQDGHDDAARAILAHEIVHFWLGAEWEALPAVLEEGLAILVAQSAVPEAAQRERAELAIVLGTLLDGSVTIAAPTESGPAGPTVTAERVMYSVRAQMDVRDIPPLREAFALDARELARLSSPGARAVLDAVAYVVVERIGVAHLHDLCEQALVQGHARIPARWLWSAARIDPDRPAGLEDAVRDMLGSAEIRAILQREDLQAAIRQHDERTSGRGRSP